MHHWLEKSRSGLATLFIDAPGAAIGSVQIWFRAGSSLEKKSNQGIAHFLEHMFFKGTPKRSGSQISGEVEAFGGELNAFTSFDFTCYFINCPGRYLANSVDILLDMVCNAHFQEEELGPERGVVFEEYRMAVDSPEDYAFHRLQERSFTGGYAHPILGNEKTIKNFSRRQLLDFRKNFYNQSNALLIIAAGEMDKRKAKLAKLIEKYRMPKGPTVRFRPFKLRPEGQLEVHRRDTHLCALTIALQAPDIKNKAAAPEDLAVCCLGLGESSRLHQELVLKDSLASSAYAYTMFQADGGAHLLTLSFPYENLKKVLTRLLQTLTKALAKNFSSEEVQKIKQQYLASKVYEKETVGRYAFSLGHHYVEYGDVDDPEDFINRIRETQAPATNKALAELLARPLHLILQIPLSGREKSSHNALATFADRWKNLKKASRKPTVRTRSGRFDPRLQDVSPAPGVRLLYRKNPLTPTFALEAWLAGGVRAEKETDSGIHHLLAKTWTKGYDDIPRETLSADLESKSAGFSGFSGKHSLGLHLHGQSEHWRELAGHFNGSLMRGDFKARQVEHQKEMILRALGDQQKDPAKTCFREFDKIMFAGHPLAKNVLGTPEGLADLNSEKLQNLCGQILTKQELLLSFCGDLELDQVLEEIRPLLQKFCKKPSSTQKFAPQNAKRSSQTLYEIPLEREQTQIMCAIPGAKISDSAHLHLKMLTSHLSGMSSELFVEARERQGLCYTTRPVHMFSRDEGYWGIYMASGNDKVPAALKLIENIIAKLQKKGISKKEFSAIKKMIAGKTSLDVQTNKDYASFYAFPVMLGQKPEVYHQQLKAMEKLKYETFQASLKKLLRRPLYTLTVGPL